MEDRVSLEKQIKQSFPSGIFRMIAKEEDLDLFVQFIGVERSSSGDVLLVAPNADRDFGVVLTDVPFKELEGGDLYVYAKNDEWRLRQVSDAEIKKFKALTKEGF